MKKIFKKLRDSPAGCLSDLLLISGWVTVAVGVGMIFTPAGVVAAGIGLIGLSILIAGGDDNAAD